MFKPSKRVLDAIMVAFKIYEDEVRENVKRMFPAEVDAQEGASQGPDSALPGARVQGASCPRLWHGVCEAQGHREEQDQEVPSGQKEEVREEVVL